MSKMVYRVLEGPDGRGFFHGTLGKDVAMNLHPAAPGFVPGMHRAEKFVRNNHSCGADVRNFRILGLKVGFVNQALPPDFATELVFDSSSGRQVLSRHALRTPYAMDAVYLTRDEAIKRRIFGASIANADCPVLGIRTYGMDGDLNGFGIAHCGLGCLVPSVLKPVDGKTQTTTAVEALLAAALEHGPFSQVRTFVFGGIGPCCYGVDDKTRGAITEWCCERYTDVDWDAVLPEDSPVKGPREGQAAVDLCSLVMSELMYLEKKSDTIIHADAWDTECTACCGHDREASVYHSHVYAPKEIPDGNGGQQAPRNLSFYAVEL